MQVEITGHHIEVTSAIQGYVQEKIAKLERHFDNAIHIHMILEVQNKQRHKAEASLHLSGNHIFADATSASMYASIDALTNKLDRQILKHKEKIKNHHRHEAVRLKEESSDLASTA